MPPKQSLTPTSLDVVLPAMSSNTLVISQDEVQELMEQYKTSSEKPPFPASALVVMALFVANEPMRRREILVWIVKQSGYYNTAMLEYASHHILDHWSDCSDTPANVLSRSLLVALRDFSLPIQIHLGKSLPLERSRYGCQKPRRCTYRQRPQAISTTISKLTMRRFSSHTLLV